MRWLLLLVPLLAVVLCEEESFVIDEPEPVGIDPVEADAEEIYNKTYVEHETALERDLFLPYHPLVRPVVNDSFPIEIFLHWHIIHLSINQQEQTMTIHGHLYMTWRDMKLGWDPDKYNGIRITHSKKWQVWHPKLSVSNSASGVYSIFEISTQAHVLIQTYSKENGAKVEMYPTFSIKAGCAFDYSDFPDDYNECTVSLYTPEACDKIHLKVYGGEIPPTVMLGWGEQSDKNIVSDFEVLNVSNSVAYYRSGNTSLYEPLTDEDAAVTWSMVRVTVAFRRHSALFGVSIALPIFIVFTLMTGAFFVIDILHSIYTLIATMIILALFMEDLTQGIPLVVMGVPKSISLYGELMILIGMALGLHIVFHSLQNVTNYGPPLFISPYLIPLKQYGIGKVKVGHGQTLDWKNAVPIIRLLSAGVFAFLFLGSYVMGRIIKLAQ